MKWWDKMTKEDKIITGVAVASVITLGGVLVLKKIKKNKELAQNEVIELPVETESGGGSAPKPKANVLNKNLVLKKGSKGQEVKVLQTLLKISADGIFGSQTEAKLMAVKGVKQISLNAYPNAVKPINIGAKMQAKSNPTKLWSTKKQANGVYFNTGAKLKEIPFGESIGTYAGKTGSGQYLVKNDGVTYAVKPEEVLFY